MKKILLLIFVITLFSSFVFAASINGNPSYKLGETLILEIEGNFLEEIIPSDLEFYRRHMETSFENINLVKIQNRTFVYFQIPLEKVPDNYSVILNEVYYKVGSVTSNKDLIFNFTILNSTSPFTITNPVFETENNYEIEIINNLDYEIEILINSKNKEIEKSLFDFSFLNESSSNESNETISEDKSFWEVIFGKDNSSLEENVTIVENSSLEESVSTDSIKIYAGDTKTFTFTPKNKGWNVLRLTYLDTEYKVLTYYFGEIVEELNDSEENESVILNNSTNETLTNESFFEEKAQFTCLEMNYSVCLSLNETCLNGDTTEGKDTLCCKSECVLKETSSTGKIVGWSLLGILVLILAWFFLSKYRKPSKEVDLEELAEEFEEKEFNAKKRK